MPISTLLQFCEANVKIKLKKNAWFYFLVYMPFDIVIYAKPLNQVQSLKTLILYVTKTYKNEQLQSINKNTNT